jgi:Putative auto-transporter adhesin, head GIN domain
MKKLTLIICLIVVQLTNAQNKRMEYNLDAFSGIDCSAPLEIIITKGETQSVILDVPEKFVSFFKIKVKNSNLDIEFKNPKSGSVSINNYVKLKLFVTMKTLSSLDLSSATTVISKDTFSPDTFKLDISGACTINLNINVKTLNADVSGASTINLKGTVSQNATVDCSGASNLNFQDLIIAKGKFDLSGVSNARLNSSKNITVDDSGLASVKYKNR